MNWLDCAIYKYHFHYRPLQFFIRFESVNKWRTSTKMFKESFICACILATTYGFVCIPSLTPIVGTIQHCSASGWDEVCRTTSSTSTACVNLLSSGSRSVRTAANTYECLIYSEPDCAGTVSFVNNVGLDQTPYIVRSFSCPWLCLAAKRFPF